MSDKINFKGPAVDSRDIPDVWITRLSATAVSAFSEFYWNRKNTKFNNPSRKFPLKNYTFCSGATNSFGRAEPRKLPINVYGSSDNKRIRLSSSISRTNRHELSRGGDSLPVEGVRCPTPPQHHSLIFPPDPNTEPSTYVIMMMFSSVTPYGLGGKQTGFVTARLRHRCDAVSSTGGSPPTPRHPVQNSIPALQYPSCFCVCGFLSFSRRFPTTPIPSPLLYAAAAEPFALDATRRYTRFFFPSAADLNPANFTRPVSSAGATGTPRCAIAAVSPASGRHVTTAVTLCVLPDTFFILFGRLPPAYFGQHRSQDTAARHPINQLYSIATDRRCRRYDLRGLEQNCKREAPTAEPGLSVRGEEVKFTKKQKKKNMPSSYFLQK